MKSNPLFISIIINLLCSGLMASNCEPSITLQNAYINDVNQLAIQQMLNSGTSDSESVYIIESYKQTIWKGLAALENAVSFIPQLDSVTNIYCIHNTEAYETHSIYISLDTSVQWTENWINEQPYSGNVSVDDFLEGFSYTVDHPSITLDNIIELTFDSTLNLFPIVNYLNGIDGINYAELTPTVGDGNHIEFSSSGPIQYFTFTLGWGDCPSGCIYNRSWSFSVDTTTCEVAYLGVSGPPVDIVEWEEPWAVNCNLFGGAYTACVDLANEFSFLQDSLPSPPLTNSIALSNDIFFNTTNTEIIDIGTSITTVGEQSKMVLDLSNHEGVFYEISINGFEKGWFKANYETDWIDAEGVYVNSWFYTTGDDQNFVERISYNSMKISGKIDSLIFFGDTVTLSSICIEDVTNDFTNGCIDFEASNFCIDTIAPLSTIYFDNGISFVGGGNILSACIDSSTWNSKSLKFKGDLELAFTGYYQRTLSFDLYDVSSGTISAGYELSNFPPTTAFSIDTLPNGVIAIVDSVSKRITISGNLWDIMIYAPENNYIDNICYANILYVWPGDANSDGIANIYDVFPIGIGYNSAGPIRQNASNSWEAQYANDWSNTFNSGVNYKHADCNGDGIINLMDGFPILENYGLTHNKASAINEVEATDAWLYLETELNNVDTVSVGATLEIPVHLGTMDIPANNVYGIAFTLNYDPALVDTELVNITVDPSWLGIEGNDLMYIQKNFGTEGQLHVGMVRTDQNNISSAYGQIATLSIIIADDLAGKTNNIYANLNLNFSDVKLISVDETELPYNTQETVIVIEETSTSISDVLSKSEFQLFPNPANAEIFVSISEDIIGATAHLTDATGKIMLEVPLSQAKQRISLESFTEGMYFFKIHSNKGRLTKKIMVIK